MPMYVERKLLLKEKTLDKSCFLFGPRQTGKSWLVKNSLPPETIVYNLLDSDVYLRMSNQPSTLRKELLAKGNNQNLIVIDEIQKVPALLDEVHNLIENGGFRFLLTGSSARKLRRGGVNLLGGRARQVHLRPLSYCELGDEYFDLLTALNRGLLPSIYFSKQARLDQQSYIGTYLKEEIAQEAVTRNVPAFGRFLKIAASCSGTILSPTSVSNECGVAKSTVVEYFEILRDTLLGENLESWKKTTVRKPIESSKFYFFDVGIARCIAEKLPVKEKSVDFGDALEHFIFHELKTYIEYKRPGILLHYWRSTSGFEVDFILGEQVAIEVKGSSFVGKKELKGLRALAEENKLKKFVLVCLEEQARVEDDGILILPVVEFLRRLWADEFADPVIEI